MQLIQDYEDYAEVNKQLEKMGYNIGVRLIEDFLAKSAIGRCTDFREVGEVVSKVSVYSMLPSSNSNAWLNLRLDLNLFSISPRLSRMGSFLHHRRAELKAIIQQLK